MFFDRESCDWQKSYDNRNLEPCHLSVKFPLLLLTGSEGIAVGLSTKILPHNFCELIKESIAILKGYKPQLLPDFITGGSADFPEERNSTNPGRTKWNP